MTRNLAIFARDRRLMSSEDFPLNIEPQQTSIAPLFLGVSVNIFLIFLTLPFAKTKLNNVFKIMKENLSVVRAEIASLKRLVEEMEQRISKAEEALGRMENEDSEWIEDDMPLFDLPELEIIHREETSASHAWRNDRPGSSVSDMRSAVTLNDRVLFINSLFSGDPVAFQNAVLAINAMDGLDGLCAYVAAEHPDWDLSSDTVYRFMMAARRKLG